MVRTYRLAVPTTAAALSTITDLPTYATSILLQAPSGNAGIVYFGNSGSQLGLLAADKSISIPETKPGNIFIVGTSGDFLHLTIIQ